MGPLENLGQLKLLYESWNEGEYHQFLTIWPKAWQILADLRYVSSMSCMTLICFVCTPSYLIPFRSSCIMSVNSTRHYCLLLQFQSDVNKIVSTYLISCLILGYLTCILTEVYYAKINAQSSKEFCRAIIDTDRRGENNGKKQSSNKFSTGVTFTFSFNLGRTTLSLHWVSKMLSMTHCAAFQLPYKMKAQDCSIYSETCL